MTKIKSTKPSATLLASRRAAERVTIPIDYAMRDKRAFIKSVNHLPNLGVYMQFILFYCYTLVFGWSNEKSKI